MSFHYQVKTLQTLGQLFSFISVLSCSLKLSLMVKAGFFLVTIFFFFWIWTKCPPHSYSYGSPTWIYSMYTVGLSSTSQGAKHENSTMVSRYHWAVLCGQMLIPWPSHWWALLFALSSRLRSTFSPICHCPSFLECPKIHQDFAFCTPVCSYCTFARLLCSSPPIPALMLLYYIAVC